MDSIQTLGITYTSLRNTIETLVAKMGGDKFARAVVPIAARDALRDVIPPTWERGLSSHVVLCEALQASPEQMMQATATLESLFALRDIPADFIGSLKIGQLAIRGKALYFETDSAASIMAHCFSPSGLQERWTTAMTKNAEIYLSDNKMKRPTVTVAHSKTEESAVKALVRIASQHFQVNLERMGK